MSFTSFNVDSFTFKNPVQLDNSEIFLCEAICDSNQELSLSFSGCIKINEVNDNIVILSPNNNDVIKFTNQLYLKCLDNIFNLSKDWFESDISKEDIKKSLKKPITANIESNTIDLLCHKTSNDVVVEKDNQYLNCKLFFKGLHFNGDNFDIILEILNLNNNQDVKNNVVENVEKNEKDEEEQEEQVEQEEVDDEEEQEEVEDEDEQEEDEDEDEQEEKEPIIVNEPVELLDNDIEEVELDLDDSESNTDEMKLNLEKDNLFMIYDILNEKLRLNLFNSVSGLIEKNKYNLGDFDLDDILFDDEDSDEDSENESEDESENELE